MVAVQAYRRAIEVMKGRPLQDPTSWQWQANIHGWVGQGEGEDEELARMFAPSETPDLSAAEREQRIALARATWGKCAHNTPSFLSWHRVYLYFFERIIQNAAGVPTLGIPYWNWRAEPVLPIAFREAVGGTQSGNPLFHRTRNPGASGNAQGANPSRLEDFEVDIDMGMPVLDARLLVQGSTFAEGFGPTLEGGPHGSVHMFVGGDMSAFETAGHDPIFWSHHCNVDRLWESWAAVRNHPSGIAAQQWCNEQHTFVGIDGQAVMLKTEEVLVIAQILGLGYEYDQLEDVGIQVSSSSSPTAAGPADQPAAPASNSAPLLAAPATVSRSTGLSLSNKPASIELQVNTEALAAPSSSGAAPKIYLALKDLAASKAPGDNFAVYLNLPAGAAPDPKGVHFAGVINFFTAVKPPKGAGAPASSGSEHGAHREAVDRVLDVTATLERLKEKGLAGGNKISVTLAPVRGEVDASATVNIGAVELLRR